MSEADRLLAVAREARRAFKEHKETCFLFCTECIRLEDVAHRVTALAGEALLREMEEIQDA